MTTTEAIPRSEPAWRTAARVVRDRVLRDLLGHPLAAWRHRRTLRQQPADGHHAYTCFFRSPLQLQALSGPVLDRLAPGSGSFSPQENAGPPRVFLTPSGDGLGAAQPWGRSRGAPLAPPGSSPGAPQTPQGSSPRAPQTPPGQPGHPGGTNPPPPLRIILLACSTGAEAYSLAAWLQARRPGLAFQIIATDWQDALVRRARDGVYTHAEVFQGQPIDPAWIARTFTVEGARWIVNERTRAPVRFETADIVRDNLGTRFGQADVVLAQNVLFHLRPADAERAFGNLCAALAPRAALAIEGMDLDQRVRLTRAAQLAPLDWRVRDIHEAARRHVAERWWAYRYGCEPWLPWRRDKARRYGTLFLTSECAATAPAVADPAWPIGARRAAA